MLYKYFIYKSVINYKAVVYFEELEVSDLVRHNLFKNIMYSNESCFLNYGMENQLF